jgi:hypothetical protein
MHSYEKTPEPRKIPSWPFEINNEHPTCDRLDQYEETRKDNRNEDELAIDIFTSITRNTHTGEQFPATRKPNLNELSLVLLTYITDDLQRLTNALKNITNNVHVFDTAPDCMEYLSGIFDNVRCLVIVSDAYANDKIVLLCLQERPSVVGIYRLFNDRREILIDKHIFGNICSKARGTFTDYNKLVRKIKSDISRR